MRIAALAAFATVMAGTATEAVAQPTPRVMVSVNGAFQATRNPFTDRFDFQVNRETGHTETRYPIESGPAIDAAAGVRVWKRIGVGVAVSHFTRDEVVHTSSDVPHPFFFERPREIAGDVSANTRGQLGVHVQALWDLAVAKSVRVAVFGGPSFLRIDQDVVTSIRYDESFPFDAATFRGADTRRIRGSAVGASVGADVSWMFTRHVGLGGVVRATKADVELELPGGSTTVKAGGLSGGAGLRIAF